MAWALANSQNIAVSASSYSGAFNCSGGNLLVVAIGIKDTGGSVGSITAVTYNGVALTQLVTAANSVTTTRSAIWYLFSPASGSNTLAITADATTDEIHAAAESYTGINLATSPRANNSATATDASPTVNVTTVSGDLAVDLMSQTVRLITGAGANQTVFFSGNTIGASRATATGVSTTMSWTLTGGSAQWATVAASFIPRIDTVVTPPVTALTTTRYAPTVVTPQTVTVPVKALTTTRYAPGVFVGTRVTPPTTALALTTYTPGVILSDNKIITPGTLGLLLDLFAPTVIVTTDPPVIKSKLTVYLPTYDATVTFPIYDATRRLN